MSDTEYWAAADTETVGKALAERVESYYSWCRSSPHIKKIQSAKRHLYGGDNDAGANTSEIKKSGRKGEIANLRMGHLGNLADQRVNLALQQEPAWQPVATNADAQSVSQASTALGVLDYYYREQRVERFIRQAADDIMWSAEGFVLGGWDPKKGQVVANDPDTGEQLKEGDLTFKSPDTLDVARDVAAKSYSSLTWRIVRVPENKWDLAARYPEKAEEILSVSKEWSSSVGLRADGSVYSNETDETFVFHFFHDKTDAMPQGRYVIFASSNAVLFDGPLPFRKCPLFRAAEKELKDSPFGYCPTLDALGPQKALDVLTSAILSQQINHANRTIVGVKGSGVNPRQIGGFNYIEVNQPGQEPKALEFAEVSPQVFTFRQALIQEEQMFMNVNDIQRGVMNSNVKSGAHAALYDSIALRASSRLQKALYALAEDIGTFILHSLADFAGDSERIARIAGESHRPRLVKFKGKDMAGFDRVVVEATNHAAKTIVGKQAMADLLLEKGALGQGEIAGQRYVQLLKTGEVEQLTEAPMANAMRIKRDKELLAKGIGLAPMAPVVNPMTGLPEMELDPVTGLGKPAMRRQPAEGESYVVTHVAQTHWQDIPEYLAVLSSPEALADSRVVTAVLELVQEKLGLWRSMDPDLLALLGGPVPPSQSMTMPPAPGEPSQSGPPKAGGQSKTPNPAELPQPGDSPAKQPNLPKLPNGQQYAPDNAEALSQ